jgi:hypothetical protein
MVSVRADGEIQWFYNCTRDGRVTTWTTKRIDYPDGFRYTYNAQSELIKREQRWLSTPVEYTFAGLISAAMTTVSIPLLLRLGCTNQQSFIGWCIASVIFYCWFLRTQKYMSC